MSDQPKAPKPEVDADEQARQDMIDGAFEGDFEGDVFDGALIDLDGDDLENAEDADADEPQTGGNARPKKKAKRPQQVYTLLVEVGRKDNDGLPKGATGAAMIIYASGVDEEEAVRETVVILKQADLSPLDVTGYGSLDERLAEGHDIPDEERALMQRALDENSVVVAQMTPFFEDPKTRVGGQGLESLTENTGEETDEVAALAPADRGADRSGDHSGKPRQRGPRRNAGGHAGGKPGAKPGASKAAPKGPRNKKPRGR